MASALDTAEAAVSDARSAAELAQATASHAGERGLQQRSLIEAELAAANDEVARMTREVWAAREEASAAAAAAAVAQADADKARAEVGGSSKR